MNRTLLAAGLALLFSFSFPFAAPAGGTVAASLPVRNGVVVPADSASLVPKARGIDLRSPDNHVLSVSGGEVSAVFEAAGMWFVLVQREDVYFVYGNLDSASVCRGEVVQKGGQVGVLNEGGGVLQFQIWQKNRDNAVVANWNDAEIVAFLKGVNQD